jgi:hypothetical protein
MVEIPFCPRCQCITGRILIGPFGPHASKLVCEECGRHVKWLPHSERVIEREVDPLHRFSNWREMEQ